MSEELYTIAEFSRWARQCKSTTYNQIGAGELRAIKVGRHTLITGSERDRWLREFAKPAVVTAPKTEAAA